MVDVTHECTQFQRGLLVINSPHGVMIGGGRERKFSRRFNSPTMKRQDSDEVYVRTGEIMYEFEAGEDRYYVVYRLKGEPKSQ